MSDDSREQLWPDEDAGPYVVRLHFQDVAGRQECVGVEVWGTTPPGSPKSSTLPHVTPVTATAVRLPLGRMIAEVAVDRVQTAEAIQRAAERLPEEMVASAKQVRKAWADRGGVGRPPLYDDAHWRNVARIYSEAWAAGAPPRQAVRKAFSVSKHTAAKWVAKARDLGYLDQTRRGVAGGVPAREQGEQP